MNSIPALNTLGSPRILVVGDLILDGYLWGDVSRISPEAPVPVLRVGHREHRSGGAGSVVENLIALGIAAKLNRVDPAQYTARTRGKDFDMTNDSFAMSYEPGAGLKQYFGSEGADESVLFNLYQSFGNFT